MTRWSTVVSVSALCVVTTTAVVLRAQGGGNPEAQARVLAAGTAAYPLTTLNDFVVAKDGYAFTHQPTGDDTVTDVTPEVYPGHHGYLASDAQLNGMFVAWGHGVKRGAQLGEIGFQQVAIIGAHEIAPHVAEQHAERREMRRQIRDDDARDMQVARDFDRM